MGFLDILNPVKLITGTVDSVAGLFGQSSDQRYQRDMMNKQNAFNAEQAELNRQFQANQWQEHFDQINAYNSPSAQMSRLRSAGLNPFSSEGQAYGSSSASNATPVVPGSSASAASIPSTQSFTSRWSELAQASKAIAEADRTGIDTDFLKKTLADRITDTTARAQIQSVLAQYQNDMSKKQLEHLTQQIEETIQSWMHISSETDANNTWRQWQANAVKNKYLKDTELQEVMRSIWQNYFDKWQDAKESSEINRNNASAAAARSESSLNNVRRALADFDVKIASASNESAKRAAVTRLEESVRREYKITEELDERIEQLKHQNDWYGLRMLLEGLSQVSRGL